MKRFIVFFLWVTLFSGLLKSQSTVYFGIRGGLGVTSQYWQYNVPEQEWTVNHRYQHSHELYITGEVQATKFWRIIAEWGRSEKGFYTNTKKRKELSRIVMWKPDFVEFDNVSFHLLSKFIVPTKWTIKPYLIAGPKFDQIGAINTTEHNKDFKILGINYNWYSYTILSDYKGIVISGLLGFGLEWKRMVTIDYRFSIPFESSTRNGLMQVWEKYHGLTVGVNINEFLRF